MILTHLNGDLQILSHHDFYSDSAYYLEMQRIKCGPESVRPATSLFTDIQERSRRMFCGIYLQFLNGLKRQQAECNHETLEVDLLDIGLDRYYYVKVCSRCGKQVGAPCSTHDESSSSSSGELKLQSNANVETDAFLNTDKASSPVQLLRLKKTHAANLHSSKKHKI